MESPERVGSPEGSDSGRTPERRPFVPHRRDPMHSRMRLYQKIQSTQAAATGGGPSESPGLFATMPRLDFVVPAHVIPQEAFQGLAGLHFLSHGEDGGKQGDIVTIFSLWNTMIGSTLLTMPWGFQQAGLLGGVFFVFGMAGLLCFTCLLVVKHREDFEDFMDVCQKYLKAPGRWLYWIASISAMLGACVAYLILMSSSLFQVGEALIWLLHYMLPASHQSIPNALEHHWHNWMACILVTIIVFPLTLLKTLRPLVRLNSLGVFCVLYMLVFLCIASVYAVGPVQFVENAQNAPLISLGAGDFGGVLSLSYFIHNAIINIVKNAKHPEHVSRNVAIAYGMVAVSYCLPGLGGYLAFQHLNIDQNALTMFASSDPLAVVARLALLLQLTSVYPLLNYIIRVQFFGMLWRSNYPSFIHVFVLNAAILLFALSFAIFYPHVGTVLRFTGAFSGFVICLLFPVLVHVLASARHRKMAFCAVKVDPKAAAEEKVLLNAEKSSLSLSQQSLGETPSSSSPFDTTDMRTISTAHSQTLTTLLSSESETSSVTDDSANSPSCWVFTKSYVSVALLSLIPMMGGILIILQFV